MPKKLALFILGFMLAVGAFLLYQYVSGSRPGEIQKAKPVATGPVQSLPPAYEERDQQGNLVYLIRADKAPEPILGDDKKPIAGQYRMLKPEVTFYQVAGRIIRLVADECRIVLDQTPRPNLLPGGGAKLKDQFNLRSVELRGTVRLFISGQATDDTPPATQASTQPAMPKDPLHGGLRVYFDGPVRYDRAQDQLNASDGVHIRSRLAAFDGTGLKLAFNQKAGRIDLLRIEHGNQIIIRGMGENFLAEGSPATRPQSTQPTTRNAKTPDVYRLIMAQDIQASAGTRAIAADRLSIIFATSDDLGANKTLANVASRPAAPAGGEPVLVDPAVIPDLAEGPETVAPAEKNDIRIAWTGPMELRPADATDPRLSTPQDMYFEAVSATEKPVVLKDGDRTLQAGRIFFHSAENRVELDPGGFGKVLLADGDRGLLECPAAVIVFQKQAIFKGPGTLTVREDKANAKDVTVVSWKTQMLADLDWPADSVGAKQQFAVRHATFDGAVIKSPTFEFAANTLDAIVASVMVDKKATQVLERLVARGNIAMRSLSAGIEQGGMKADDTLEILTAPGTSGPVPSRLVASGNVSAWRLTEKPAATQPGSTPATPPAQRFFDRDAITAARLTADLRPKAKPATTPAATATAVAATKPAGDSIIPLGGDFEVVHFVAQDNVRVDLTPAANSGEQAIRAIATTLDAYPVEGKATLSSAGNTPVRVGMGENQIEARTIRLDQNAETFHADSGGSFSIVLPPDGKERKVATPIQVTWEKSMSFDNKKHVGTFVGKPIARVPGELSDQGLLRAEESLTVQLKETPKPAAQPGASPAAAPAPSASATQPGQNLTLDWIEAVGNVNASGAQFDAKNVKTHDLLFTARDQPGKPGKLRYVEESKTFTIPGPGDLVVNVNLPAGAAGSNAAVANGQSAFRWAESLTYDGRAGTIAFKKEVMYLFAPRDGFIFTRTPGAASAPARNPATREIAELTTDQLVARLAPPATQPAPNAAAAPKTAASPLGIGTGDLLSVETSGGTFVKVGGYQLGGTALTFNVPAQTITITGNAEDRVVFEQPSTGNRGTTSRIFLDMKKDKGFLDLGPDFRGNFVPN